MSTPAEGAPDAGGTRAPRHAAPTMGPGMPGVDDGQRGSWSPTSGAGVPVGGDEVPVADPSGTVLVGSIDDEYADDEWEAGSRDWAWVEEWRASGEPPAWAPGITLALFTAVIVGLAVLVLSRGLAGLPWLAVSANVLVAAGLAPALWLSRNLPVLRWISAGAAAGVLLGWIAALLG